MSASYIDNEFTRSCLEYAEAGFACSDGPAYSVDALGQPYKVVVSGGTRMSSERLPALFETPQAAVRAWTGAVAEEACAFRLKTELSTASSIPRLRLFWRIKPEMQELVRYTGLTPDDIEEKWYTVYSRLSFAAPEKDKAASLSEAGAPQALQWLDGKGNQVFDKKRIFS